MKKQFYRKEIQDANKAKKTVSTLLIPDQYLEHYKNQCKKHSGRSSYFQYLLTRFAPQVKFYEQKMLKEKDHKWKTYYQAKLQNLNRCNFRPSPRHWEQLRHTANSFGISMCYLFIFLIKLEISEHCTPNYKNRGNSNNKNQKMTINFITCIRRVNFQHNFLKRELIYSY